MEDRSAYHTVYVSLFFKKLKKQIKIPPTPV